MRNVGLYFWCLESVRFSVWFCLQQNIWPQQFSALEPSCQEPPCQASAHGPLVQARAWTRAPALLGPAAAGSSSARSAVGPRRPLLWGLLRHHSLLQLVGIHVTEG